MDTDPVITLTTTCRTWQSVIQMSVALYKLTEKFTKNEIYAY